MSKKSRRFHIGDVLSLVIGVNVSPRGWAGLEALEDFVAGRPLTKPERSIHYIAIKNHVRRQFPDLEQFCDDAPSDELLPDWLARRAAEFGEYQEVEPHDPPLPVGARSWR